MARLIQQGRYADEIMTQVAAEDAQRGRNDPCPCGTGTKFKHCHGAPGRQRTKPASL